MSVSHVAQQGAKTSHGHAGLPAPTSTHDDLNGGRPMRQSRTFQPARQRHGAPRRASVTTAAGLAAERIALADRERARRTSRARTAARHLEERPATR